MRSGHCRGGSRLRFEQAVDGLLQPLEVDRLGQVLGETGRAGAADIVLHAESAQGDAAQAALLARSSSISS